MHTIIPKLINNMNKRTLLAACFAAATMGLSAQKAMTPPQGGKQISDELIGIFFEDINNSADGQSVTDGVPVRPGNRSARDTRWEPFR